MIYSINCETFILDNRYKQEDIKEEQVKVKDKTYWEWKRENKSYEKARLSFLHYFTDWLSMDEEYEKFV